MGHHPPRSSARIGGRAGSLRARRRQGRRSSRGIGLGADRRTFARIAVRGTRFFAGDISGTFGVFAAHGSVDVTAGGKKVRLKAGEGTDIAHPVDAPGPVKTWGAPKIAKAMALVT